MILILFLIIAFYILHECVMLKDYIPSTSNLETLENWNKELYAIFTIIPKDCTCCWDTEIGKKFINGLLEFEEYKNKFKKTGKKINFSLAKESYKILSNDIYYIKMVYANKTSKKLE